jgi:hypothetical protein
LPLANGLPTFNDEAFEVAWNDVAQWLHAAVVECVVLCPIVGLESDVLPLAVGKASLVPLSDEELAECIEADMAVMLPSPFVVSADPETSVGLKLA